MKRWLYIGGAAVALAVVAFLAGRFSAPVKTKVETKVETKTVTVTEWKDRVVVQRGPVQVRTVTHEVPGGERVIEKWIERGPVTTTSDLTGQSHGTTESTSATVKVSESGRPEWAAGLSGTWAGRPSSMPDRIGLELDRRIVGTLWLGLRASSERDLSARQVGIALRLEF